MGILGETAYESGSIVLEPGDWLIVFTDGLVEAENTANDEYGEPRLLAMLQGNNVDTPDDLLRRMMADLDRFVGAAPQHDDVTCMLIKVVP